MSPTLSSPPKSSFTFLILSILLIIVSHTDNSVDGFACRMGSASNRISSGRVSFEVTGLGGKFSILRPSPTDMSPKYDSYTYWAITGFEEWAPKDGVSCVDPEDNPNQARRLWTIDLKSNAAVCSMQKKSYTLAPGVLATSIIVKGTYTEFPDFSIEMNTTIVDKPFMKTYENTTFHNSIPYNVSYRPQTIKIGLSANGFPWNGTYPTSYLVVRFEAGIYLGEFGALDFVNGVFSLSGNSTIDGMNMFQSYDKTTVIDGIPYLQDFSISNEGNYPAVPPFADFPWDNPYMVLCKPGQIPPNAYNILEYDPTFSSLFGAEVLSEGPADSLSPKRGFPVVAVVVPIVVGIILITTIVVLLAIFNPTVRTFFRPYDRTQATAQSTSGYVKAKPARSTWKSVRKRGELDWNAEDEVPSKNNKLYP